MKYSALKNPLLLFFLFLITFALSACSGDGSSDPPVNDTTPDTTVNLNAPEQVRVNAGNGRVYVTWTSVPKAFEFNIYYGTTPGVTKASGTKVEDQHSPSASIKGLTNGTTYYFVVTSVNDSGESDISAEASATPSATPPPKAPTDVTAEAGIYQALISWTPSADATSYTIYYQTAPNVTTASPTYVTNAVSPQVVSPLINSQTYYFVVTATNADGESAPSFETHTTPLASPPPLRPSGVTAAEGDGQATISWSPVDGAISYNVYYTSQKFVISKTTGTKVANATRPAVITGLTNKVAYFFVVTAVNGSGESADSSVVSATPMAESPAPTLVEIPAESFQMGDSLDDIAYALPVHDVDISTFYIDKYSTTYELWKTVYDWATDHGYEFDHVGTNGSEGYGTNMPVTTINWYDVLKWLNARSQMEGRTPVYYTDSGHTVIYKTGQEDLTNDKVDWSANGYRLPTEAEWEKAARGKLVGKRYPWGDVLSSEMANYNMLMTTSVGVYPANGYGLHDMAGNVFQWVWDCVTDKNRDYSDTSIYNEVDTHGPNWVLDESRRIRRGGAYAEGDEFLKCAERVFRAPTYAAPYFGFRSASNALNAP